MKNFIILLIPMVLINAGDVKAVTKLCHTSNKRQYTVKTSITAFLPNCLDTTLEVNLSEWKGQDFLNQVNYYSGNTINGHITVELDITEPRMISLDIANKSIFSHYNGHSILVEPGDSVFIQIPDLANVKFMSLNFSGIGAKKQTMIQAIEQKFLLKSLSPQQYWHQSLEQAIDLGLELKEYANKILLQNRTEISSQAFTILKASTLACIYDNAVRFFFRSDMTSTGVQNLYRDTWISNFILNVDHPDVILTQGIWKSALYNMALLEYLITNRLPYNKDLSKDKTLIFSILQSTFKSVRIKNWILANYIISKAKQNGWDKELEVCAKQFLLDTSSKNTYHQQVEEIRYKLKFTLRENSLAYNFSLRDRQGKTVEMKDFEDKIVLIDFMFYGCPGCKLMAPVLTDIEDYYKNMPELVMISISIDKTKTLFEKGMGVFSSPSSIHLYTNGEGINHPVIKYYSIQSYPTLVLINKKGRIITSRAPDPRSEKGKTALLNLINTELKLID